MSGGACCLGRWNCGVGSGANGFLAEGLGRADDYARKSRRGWHQGRLKVGKSDEGRQASARCRRQQGAVREPGPNSRMGDYSPQIWVASGPGPRPCSLHVHRI